MSVLFIIYATSKIALLWTVFKSKDCLCEMQRVLMFDDFTERSCWLLRLLESLCLEGVGFMWKGWRTMQEMGQRLSIVEGTVGIQSPL